MQVKIFSDEDYKYGSQTLTEMAEIGGEPKIRD